MLATTATLVLVLTGLFLLTVFDKFAKVAEENAKGRFSLVTQRASAEITNLVKGISHSVLTLSSSAPSALVREGKINQNDLVSTFMGSLANDPNVYSHYFGLSNEEFLQVIGVRADQKIIDSLRAPAGTYFAVRRITQGEKRTEHWQFIDKNRIQIQERTEEASYSPAERPWFVGALKKHNLFITPPYVFSSTGEPGLTISAPLSEKTGVFGTDINLGDLNKFLAGLSLTPNAAILMLDDHNQILAFHGQGQNYDDLKIAPLTPFEAVGHPLFKSLINQNIGNEAQILALGSNSPEQFFVVSSQISETVDATRFKVIAMAPMRDFIGPIDQARRDVLLVSGSILLLLLPLSLLWITASGQCACPTGTELGEDQAPRLCIRPHCSGIRSLRNKYPE